MKTGRKSPAKMAKPPRLWSRASSWASCAMATTKTRSKKSSSQDEWRSSSPPSPAVRSAGGGVRDGHRDLAAEREGRHELELVAAPEAPRVIPAGRALAREQAHGLVSG